MRIFSLLLISFLAFSCSEDVKKEGNNGAQNNGLSNNGQNNGLGSNNGQSTSGNNGTTNNGFTTSINNSNGGSNNGTTAAGTTCPAAPAPPTVSAMCSEKGFGECFSNFDCEECDVCTNISDNATQIACCVPGVRGTKKLGDDCTGDDDTTCESGICIAGVTNKSFCSGPCLNHDECPAFMKCVAALSLCAEGTRE